MQTNQLLKQAFILLLVIAVLDVFNEIFYLHLTVWWFDVLLHFLSGLCVSIGGISFWFSIFRVSNPKQLKIILTGLGWAIIVGLLWEIFELYFGLTLLSDGIIYWRDTTSDLLVDVSGGILGVVYATRIIQIRSNDANNMSSIESIRKFD